MITTNLHYVLPCKKFLPFFLFIVICSCAGAGGSGTGNETGESAQAASSVAATETQPTVTLKAERRAFLEKLGTSQYGDPTANETMSLDELEELRKTDGGAGNNLHSESGDHAATTEGIRNLMAKADGLASKAKEFYETNRDAMDLLLSGMKSYAPTGWLIKTKEERQEEEKLLSRYADDRSMRAIIGESKDHIMEIFSPGGYGYYLRVHTFIVHGIKELERSPYTPLAKIYRVSRLQSTYLDEDLHARIAAKHGKNKKWEVKDIEGVTAVVIGGGPIGRWSILLAYKAGFNVLAVERNHREYCQRKRNIRLDSIWMEQIRWFLGIIFDNYTIPAFEGDWPLIHADESSWSLMVDLNVMEEVLDEGLEALIKHVDMRREQRLESVDTSGRLEMRNEAEVTKVLFPTDNNNDYNSNYYVQIKKWSSKKDKDDGEKPIKEWLEKFGVLINAGGATKNEMRDVYMGMPEPQTVTGSYFAIVADRYDREQRDTASIPFTAGRWDIDRDFLRHQSMENMPRVAKLIPYFDPFKVTAIVAAHKHKCPLATVLCLPAGQRCRAVETVGKWASTLGDAILKEAAERQLVIPAVFNTKDNLQIYGETPEALADFNADLREETERLELSATEADICRRMRDQVNNYFFAAMIRMIVERGFVAGTHEINPHAEDLVNVDEQGKFIPTPPSGGHFLLSLETDRRLNAQVFDVSQSILRRGADFYYIFSRIAFFNQFGDGLVDAHFFTGNACSTARWGAEDGIGVLARLYPAESSQLTRPLAEEIVGLQNSVLDAVKASTLERGGKFIRPIDDPQEKSSRTQKRAANLVDVLSKEKERHVDAASAGKAISLPYLEKFGFGIECLNVSQVNVLGLVSLGNKQPAKCVDSDRPDFKLHLYNGRRVNARVSEDGRFARKLLLQPHPATNYERNEEEKWEKFNALAKAALIATERPAEPKPIWVY